MSIYEKLFICSIIVNLIGLWIQNLYLLDKISKLSERIDYGYTVENETNKKAKM